MSKGYLAYLATFLLESRLPELSGDRENNRKQIRKKRGEETGSGHHHLMSRLKNPPHLLHPPQGERKIARGKEGARDDRGRGRQMDREGELMVLLYCRRDQQLYSHRTTEETPHHTTPALVSGGAMVDLGSNTTTTTNQQITPHQTTLHARGYGWELM